MRRYASTNSSTDDFFVAQAASGAWRLPILKERPWKNLPLIENIFLPPCRIGALI